MTKSSARKKTEEIEGVEIKKIKASADGRGWLTEIFRNDTTKHRPKMAYVSHTEQGSVRGPHEHSRQSDYFAFPGYGDFILYLWDGRARSKTYGARLKLVVGQSNKVSVRVPPGVVHGYKSVSRGGSLCINLADRLYMGPGKKGRADEIRHEKDENSDFVMD